jgi:hypothetical protein
VRFFARAHIRRDDEVSARGQALETIEAIFTADEAIAAARKPGGEKLVMAVARIIAVEHDAPLLRIDVLVAQRRERNPDLECPAALLDLRRGFPEEVRRRILSG